MPIAFFDMDGTLTKVSTPLFLGRHLGIEDKIKENEGLIERKEITDAQWVMRMGELLNGHPLTVLEEVYHQIHLIDGIRETVEYLKQRDYTTAIITAGIGEFARYLQRDFGFDYCHGTTTLKSKDKIAGLGAPVVTAEGKAAYIRQLCSAHDTDPQQCFAVGDSYTDIPMLELVGTSIAINHSDSVAGHANHYIKPCNNLTEVLEFLP